MCPDALEFLQDGIRSQRLGVLDRALDGYMAAAALAEDPDVRAEALTRQAHVLRAQCQWAAAIAVAQRARQVACEAGLATRIAEAYLAEANVRLAHGELDAALPIFEELLATTEDPRIRGLALQNVGQVHAQRGALAEAEAAFAESYRYFECAGYVRGQAIARVNQGRAALDRGDAAAAAPVLESALVLAREAEDGELIADTLVNLAEALLPMHPTRAEELACTALGHFRTSGNHRRHVESLRILGEINEHRGHREQALACYARGLELARQIDARQEIGMLEERLRRVT